MSTELDILGTVRAVPNQFPRMSAPYRLAIVGEAPGVTEEQRLEPFCGASGTLLNDLLAAAGIQRDACFVGNVCQVRPPDNDIRKFAWTHREIQSGLAQLQKDLSVYQPNMVLLLGNAALHAFKSNMAMLKKPSFPITAWRGSLFLATATLPGVKCLATFHPASILRVFNDAHLCIMDLKRVRKEAETKELVFMPRTLTVNVTLDYLFQRFAEITQNKTKISIDIEGGCSGIKCCSVAVSPTDSFIVPFENMDGTSYWSFDDEVRLWRVFSTVLSDDQVPKVLQYALFDRFVFMWLTKLVVRGQVDDTLLKTWEFMCEWDKGLEVQCSVYTRQPYYASMIVMDKKAKSYWARLAGVPIGEFFKYCCLDAAVTYECNEVLEKSLKGSSVNHYQFNMSLLNIFLYIEYKGVRLDIAKRNARIEQLQGDLPPLQAAVEKLAGHSINVRSSQQVSKFLYEELGLPLQYKRGAKADEDGNRKTTTDYEAVLALYKKTGNPGLMTFIRLKEMLKRISDLETLTTDHDSRIRFSYNPCGTVTGRTSCSQSATGSGTNGQTIPDANPIFTTPAMRAGARDLFLADEDYFFFQCDLKGADGWTVAAHCARLGDRTMLDDLNYGLKIPQILALIVMYGVGINQLDRATLKERCKEVKKDDHLYFSLKQVQHGSNYGMKPPTVAIRVTLESYGEVTITNIQAAQYQQAYLTRYKGILRWHDWMREQVRKGFLTKATGHRRIFTGRKGSDDTLREALSDEPQAVTTYATNLAALNLWRDPDNRRQDGSLRVQPLHQVHDALCGQFRKEDTAWAITRIQSYFNNEITIAGIPIIIPFDGRYGYSWGELECGKI